MCKSYLLKLVSMSNLVLNFFNVLLMFCIIMPQLIIVTCSIVLGQLLKSNSPPQNIFHHLPLKTNILFWGNILYRVWKEVLSETLNTLSEISIYWSQWRKCFLCNSVSPTYPVHCICINDQYLSNLYPLVLCRNWKDNSEKKTLTETNKEATNIVGFYRKQLWACKLTLHCVKLTHSL